MTRRRRRGSLRNCFNHTCSISGCINWIIFQFITIYREGPCIACILGLWKNRATWNLWDCSKSPTNAKISHLHVHKLKTVVVEALLVIFVYLGTPCNDIYQQELKEFLVFFSSLEFSQMWDFPLLTFEQHCLTNTGDQSILLVNSSEWWQYSPKHSPQN